MSHAPTKECLLHLKRAAVHFTGRHGVPQRIHGSGVEFTCDDGPGETGVDFLVGDCDAKPRLGHGVPKGVYLTGAADGIDLFSQGFVARLGAIKDDVAFFNQLF